MHGCSSASVLIVNAEVDSMGGVVEGGGGIDNKTSPHKAAIEKVQAELRQECDVRDERRRELEFLEKGGNPLDFKLGFVASVSVQSTSITDQHPDRFVSEAKGSFPFTASPHGDSVESSGRPGTNPWEPNSADNLMLFDAEHEVSEGGRSLLRRSNAGPSQMEVGRKILEHGDSAAFGVPRKAYRRRYRSRPNRDGAKSSSTDVNPARGVHGSSLPSHHGTRDAKGMPDAENQNTSSNWNSKPTTPTNDILPKTIVTNGQDNLELDASKSFHSTKVKSQGVSIDTASGAIVSENPLNEQLNQPSVAEQLNQPSFAEQPNQPSISVAADTPKQMDTNGPEALEMEEMKSAVIVCQPSVTARKVENAPSSCQINGFSRQVGDDLMTDGVNISASRGTKVLDSESSGMQTSLGIDGNNDSEMFTRVIKIESNGNSRHLLDENPGIKCDKSAILVKKDTEGIDRSTLVDKESASTSQSLRDKYVSIQPEKEVVLMESALENKVNDHIIADGMEATCHTQLEAGRKLADPSVDNRGLQNERSSDVRHQESVDGLDSHLPEVGILTRVSTVPVEAQTSVSDPKVERETDEDSILKEAQIIEAKRKRIAELSLVTSPVEIRRKSHWDYVLEEMAWMANDFAQERIWKVAAASRISYRVALTCLLRKKEKNSGMNAKRVAYTLAKAVMEFWHSIESQVQETSKELEQQRQKNGAISVRAYAVRFLKCNKPNISCNQVVVPLTPDGMSDSGTSDLTWEDSLTEENLFYTIPPGALETYRMAIESHVAQLERTGSTGQEEVETSAFDAATDLESQDNAYDEDDGETNTFNMPVAFEGCISSGYGQKKRKHLRHAYGPRSYEMGSDLLPMQFAESKLVTSQSGLLAKRPGSNLNVSIPTKRMRTASRRVISPFGVGASGCNQVPNKTDASSCDTSSFQDDQSTLRGGLLVPNSLEVDSAGEFEKQLPFDTSEVSMRPKKKKKAKHLNAAYEQRWQVDSSFQNEQFQRDHLQRRSESHQLESNGNSGLLAHPIAKKPKLMRQQDTFDIIQPTGGSVPSPVGSQISNMSNPNKFIKMLGGRDRGRKAKALKMPAGQPGSGVPWSLFEDQALVVLAHDLGPNWELVSDAFNSALQFKCIFRKAKDCKERHIFLMDRTSGDGADSAEDSGSSQPYPSTLPGIPKGSARQLFQRLQGPMEEETLKSHFEKIIMIGKKQHYRRTQDPKQFQQPHSSHTVALSQICPNNLNGGPILTPLDLCDASISGPDLGFQGALSSGAANPNQGPVSQMLPPSSASSALPGSSNMVIGNSFSSSPGSVNPSTRYVVPRSGSLPADEHQRMHLYNPMLPGRNTQPANISAPGALPGTDRGGRMLPSGNGMGIVPGVSRNMPMARPGFQGHPPSPMVSSGSVGASGMSSPNMQAGVGAAQGSSMVRGPMMRPGPNQDPQRQTLVPDHQMPTNSQGMSHFGTSPPVASYPLHHQPSHAMSPQQSQVSPHHHQPHFQGPANHTSNPQQQAYAVRLAKERQLHQRFLQQQQYASSNPLMPHVQTQHQHPISSPLQNSSQVQSQTNSAPVSHPPLTSAPVNTMPQHQQKHQTPTQGVARSAQASGSGLANQTGKQRQRQQNQFSQANRQHPQQRQGQQQAKVVKGVGRGNPMMHQNVPVDVNLSNGVSTNPANQSVEKGEPAMNSMQSQGPYSGPPQNSVQPTRPFVASQSNQPSTQQKIYSGQGSSSSSKHLQQTPQSDNSSQGPSNQKLVNQNQTASQRLVQPNRHINSAPSTKQQSKDSDTNQHPSSSSAEMDRTTIPQASNYASNATQVVPQPTVHKWHASDPLSDTNAFNSPKNLSSMGSLPSNTSVSVPQAGQGLAPRPTTSLPLTRGDVSAQWPQQQQSQLQQPHSTVHSQQQGQLLQAGRDHLYGRSNETRLE